MKLLLEKKPTYLSIYGSTALCWTLAVFSVSWSFTQFVGLLGRGVCQSQGRYLHTDIHALCGIRTHDPSVRKCEDTCCLRPCGHCDRLAGNQIVQIKWRRWNEKAGKCICRCSLQFHETQLTAHNLFAFTKLRLGPFENLSKLIAHIFQSTLFVTNVR
jgi:hypothetical protein